MNVKTIANPPKEKFVMWMHLLFLSLNLVIPIGFEPMTPKLEVLCSLQAELRDLDNVDIVSVFPQFNQLINFTLVL